MSVHINEVLDYLEEHPIRCAKGEVTTVLEMLHDVYCEHNIHNEEINAMYADLSRKVSFASDKEAEELYAWVAELCWEHEKIAFSHGILVGMHFMTEVNYLL